jgi:hypothetical protein
MQRICSQRLYNNQHLGDSASPKVSDFVKHPVKSRAATENHFEVPEVDYEKLGSDREWESSASILERVQAVQERQQIRSQESDIVCPVREPGLSSRAGTGIITPSACAWPRCGNSAQHSKRLPVRKTDRRSTYGGCSDIPSPGNLLHIPVLKYPDCCSQCNQQVQGCIKYH